ncbi:tail fiber protein [uncultured Gimesia sp.]|uniref:tail fiber protein n=1 Tax=uncultured Gimesia sp. TaxID=1678688 RepID=UPI0030DA7C3A|tara:strand:+ start:14119 stop:15477 length:1359 start_codon:yes stop_codon:yes gene_type:complete
MMGFIYQKLTLIVLGAGCFLGLQNDAAANDTDAYLGEIRMFAGNYAPRGWAFCDGQILPISQHDALFALLGINFGGDGLTTFGLPDLRGRFPMHVGQGPGLTNRKLGQKLGQEKVTFTAATVAVKKRAGDASLPGVSVIETLRAQTNMPPYQAVHFIIALVGTFPAYDILNNSSQSGIKPYLGEIRMFAGNFAPGGWAQCNGQLLASDDYPALANVLSSTYARDYDATTFGLPDLRGRIPRHHSNRGEKQGTEEVTPTASTVVVRRRAADDQPEASVSVPETMHADSNMPPSQAITFFIALKGAPAKSLEEVPAKPYYGEIRMLAGSDIPAGWMQCGGQILPISENTALFSLLGTIYGGNGRRTFGLPDLRTRFPMHAGRGPGLTQRRLGEKGGAHHVASTATTVAVERKSSIDTPEEVVFVQKMFSDQPNMPPSLTVNFIIATKGIFPPRP